MFPIGKFLKSDVRSIAKLYDLHVSNKRDSTGICFIGNRKFHDFINEVKIILYFSIYVINIFFFFLVYST